MPSYPSLQPDEAGDYEDDDQPRTPKSAIRGGNMLPACITRLTQLEELRLAGDWRRPKVPASSQLRTPAMRLLLGSLWAGTT